MYQRTINFNSFHSTSTSHFQNRQHSDSSADFTHFLEIKLPTN